MKKALATFLILFLILFTAITKNSTKRIDDEIFVIKENMRDLRKNFEKIKLEHDYLSSTERLLKFQNLYFDEELVKKDVKEIKVIDQNSKKIQIKKLILIND